jgi:hypothetical protein
MKHAHLLPLAACCGLLLGLGHQAQAQVFDVDIPPTTVINSDASSLRNTLGDAAGNTLYVVDHRLGGQLSGQQWVLVSGKGAILASREFGSGSAFPIRIAFFSSRRILAQVDSGNGVFVEGFRPVDGQLESEGILVALPEVVGDVTGEAANKLPAKFFDVSISTNGKLTSIQRFDVTKLRPAAN